MTASGLSLPERHIQRLEHQLAAQMGRHRPANDAAAPGVHNDREIQEAGPRTDVSDVGYPELIRPVSREISIDQKSNHLPIALAALALVGALTLAGCMSGDLYAAANTRSRHEDLHANLSPLLCVPENIFLIEI